MSRHPLLLCALLLASCSSQKEQPPAAAGAAKTEPSVPLAVNRNHPLAKYVEVAGFRMSEKPGGKLAVRLVVINHSQAELTDLGLEVSTPPCTLTVKVPALAPEESKDVTGECTTKMRVYELPDWMFVRPAFKIVAPAA
jgi:hypothetical protein